MNFSFGAGATPAAGGSTGFSFGSTPAATTTAAATGSSFSFGGAPAQWRVMDRRLNIRFTVLGGSAEKYIFFQSSSF